MHILRIALAVGLTFGFATLASSQNQASPESVEISIPTAGEIEAWIDGLDAPRFAEREEATIKLVKAGAATIPLLYERLKSANSEVGSRGIYILRQLAFTGEFESQDAAEKALQGLIAEDQVVIAQQASKALGDLRERRQTQAVAQLEKLAAVVERDMFSFGVEPSNSFTVKIESDLWKGQLEDLRHLKLLKDCIGLTLTGKQVTDDWITPIQQMQRLKHLEINRGSITDNALNQLQDCVTLTSLTIKYSPITDDSVTQLSKLQQLQELHVFGTRLTPQAAENLRITLGSTEIDYRRGAFLGVGCRQPPFPCFVSEVRENTAAAKAGIELHDIIVKYDGTMIRDFNDLRAQIAQNIAGDTVELELMRGGRQRIIRTVHSAGVEFGMETETHVMGLRISKVENASFAHGLRLKPGDIITTYKGQQVTKSSDLKAAFDKNVEGEVIIIQSIQGVEHTHVQVTFGEWD